MKKCIMYGEQGRCKNPSSWIIHYKFRNAEELSYHEVEDPVCNKHIDMALSRIKEWFESNCGEDPKCIKFIRHKKISPND